MALDDVINARNNLLQIEAIEHEFSEKPYDSNLRNIIDNYMPEIERDSAMGKSPDIVHNYLTNFKGIAQQRAISRVGENLEATLNSLDDNRIRAYFADAPCAEGLTGEKAEAHKKYLKRVKQAKTQDIDSYLNEQIAKGENDKEKELIRRMITYDLSADPKSVERIFSIRIQKAMKEFLAKFQDRNGNLDQAAARAYITENINAYSDEQKDEAYISLAKLVKAPAATT